MGHELRADGKSLKYTRNNSGQGTDPRGKPLATVNHRENDLAIRTNKERTGGKLTMQHSSSLSTPVAWSFNSKRLYGTLSYAMLKSTTLTPVGYPVDLASDMLSQARSMLATHDRCLQNSFCCGQRMWLAPMWPPKLAVNRCSIALLVTDEKQIGR